MCTFKQTARTQLYRQHEIHDESIENVLRHVRLTLATALDKLENFDFHGARRALEQAKQLAAQLALDYAQKET